MSVVDLRYARALDEVVAGQNLNRDEVKAQIEDFVRTLDGSKELREVLGNPSIPEPQKLGLLDALAGRIGMNRTVRNFVAVVVHHERLAELSEIAGAYLEMSDRDTGVAEAEVVSARPLDEATRHELESSIAQMAGESKVRATYREDPSLLGGAVVTVGSTVYDGSVRGQLQQMKRQMIASA